MKHNASNSHPQWHMKHGFGFFTLKIQVDSLEVCSRAKFHVF